MHKIIPIYPELNGISSNTIYKIINQIKSYIFLEELLPYKILKEHNMLNINKALKNIHFPQNISIQKATRLAEVSKYRLALEEVLAHHLSAKKARLNKKNTPFAKITVRPSLFNKFVHTLDFIPTQAQYRVVKEIFKDLLLPKPSTRLIQGDVGSGKTFVAAAVIIQASANRLQSVFNGTNGKFLLKQHYHNFSSLLKSFNIPILFITGRLTKTKI